MGQNLHANMEGFVETVTSNSSAIAMWCIYYRILLSLLQHSSFDWAKSISGVSSQGICDVYSLFRCHFRCNRIPHLQNIRNHLSAKQSRDQLKDHKVTGSLVVELSFRRKEEWQDIITRHGRSFDQNADTYSSIQTSMYTCLFVMLYVSMELCE